MILTSVILFCKVMKYKAKLQELADQDPMREDLRSVRS